MTNTQQGSTEDLRGELAERAAEPNKPGITLERAIYNQEREIAKALPVGVTNPLTPERYLRAVISDLHKPGSKLPQCTRVSLLGAVMTGAQLGLEFGPLQQGYLVPYWNNKLGSFECQLIIGYKGYIDLARRSGNILDIVARPVYEKDEYDEYSDEHGDHMIHRPNRDEDRGQIVRYFGRVRYTNGGVFVHGMNLADIDARKQRSAAVKNGWFSPWVSDPLAMSLKTVIRSMVPFLPLTSSVVEMVQKDDGVFRQMPDHSISTFFPDPDEPVHDNPPIEAQAAEKTAERSEAEAALDRMITTLPDRRDQDAAGRWLIDNFGPIPNLDDEQLAAATKGLDDWLNNTPAAAQPTAAPAASDSAPAAPEPAQEGETPPDTDSEETGPPEEAPPDPGEVDPVTAEVLQEARDIRSALPEDKRNSADEAVLGRQPDGKYIMDGRAVNRALAQRQIPTRGTVDARRVLLAAHLSKEAYESESEDPTTVGDA